MDGHIVRDTGEIANEFNKYFCEIGPKLVGTTWCIKKKAIQL